MGNALTVARAQCLLRTLPTTFIRLSAGGDHRHLGPGRLIKVINERKVEVQPFRHGKTEIVEIDDVSEWDSRNKYLAAQLGIDLDSVPSNGTATQNPKPGFYYIISKSRKAVYIGRGCWSANGNHGAKFSLKEAIDIFTELSEKEADEEDLQYLPVEEALLELGRLTPVIESVKPVACSAQPALPKKGESVGLFVPTVFPVNASAMTKFDMVKTRQRNALEKLLFYRREVIGCNEELGKFLMDLADAPVAPLSEPILPEKQKAKRGSVLSLVIETLHKHPGSTLAELRDKLPHNNGSTIGVTVYGLKKKGLVKITKDLGRKSIFTLTVKGMKKFQ